MRKFASGATRDDDSRKYDFEGILSPLVLKEYGRYMHAHATQSDDEHRPADNWQAGIPREQLMKSAYRHFIDWHTLHDGYPAYDFDGGNVDILEALSAVLFNTMAYMHAVLAPGPLHVASAQVDELIAPKHKKSSLLSAGEELPTGPGYHEKLSK